jgi:hypothetical protein
MKSTQQPPARLAVLLTLLLLLSSGCHYQAELTIAANGSGHGRVVLYDPPLGVTKEDVARQLGINGFQVLAVSAPSPETLAAEVAWKDFEQPFRRRIVNPDHSITLDFGPIEQGRLQVQVPGRIDAEDTTGTLDGPRNATFHGGRARLTYVPSAYWTLVLVAMVAAMLVGTATIALWVSRKRSP